MTLYHPSTRGILNFTNPSLWSLLSSQHLVIVYGIHFSTVAYFWAKWVAWPIRRPLSPSLSFPTPVENEPGARDAMHDKTTRQAGCYRNIHWPSGSIGEQRGQHPFQVKSWRSCRLQVVQTHMFGYGMWVYIPFYSVSTQCWIRFLNTGLLYDMQLKSLLVSQAWWPKTHQLWMIHIENHNF